MGEREGGVSAMGEKEGGVSVLYIYIDVYRHL